MKILIVKLSAIGDVIHTLPSLAALRRCYPDAEISWVVEEAASDLLVDHPDLNRLLISRRKGWLKEIRQGRIAKPFGEMRAFIRELRSRRYDIVVDFHGLFKSALIVLLSGGRRKLGYRSLQEGSALFYNERIPEEMGKHAVDRYLDLVRHLAGGPDTACPATTPEFRIAIGEREVRCVEALLGENGAMLGRAGNGEDASPGGKEGENRPFVAVNPVAFWETKLWEEEKFAALCDRIRTELRVGVVLTGGEAGPLDRIRARMKGTAANLGGLTTLRELAALYRLASLVVTTDSGPMHLAAAMGTPVVALFGPTDPGRTGPYGAGHRVIRREISCSPCLRKECKAPRCMTDITVEEVFSAVRETVVVRGVSPGKG